MPDSDTEDGILEILQTFLKFKIALDQIRLYSNILYDIKKSKSIHFLTYV